MNILLLGATGRVGKAVTDIILGNGHQLTILVRDKNKIKSQNPQLKVVEGDIYDWALLKDLVNNNFDAVINAIAADPSKPSTLVSDVAIAIGSLFDLAQKHVKYVGLTGIAQMQKSFLGRLSIFFSRSEYAIDDYQQAYETLEASSLDWCLIAVPRVTDGPVHKNFSVGTVFKGGIKKIHAGDLAIAICNELVQRNSGKIIGVWY